MSDKNGSLWDTEFGEVEIGELVKGFTDTARWANAFIAARHFWKASEEAKSPFDDEAMKAWHLLVLSVGNFKRQAPITLPSLPDVQPIMEGARPRRVDVPLVDGTVHTIDVDNRSSWERLALGIVGISVASATTLLSALWPGQHVILDIRDLTAARGLDYRDAKRIALVEVGGLKRDPVTWSAYDWFLERVRTKANESGYEPISVERALYVLDAREGRSSGGVSTTEGASQVGEGIDH